MKFKALMLLQLINISAAFANLDGEWGSSSRPSKMAEGFTHKMSALPLEGLINEGTKGWSGDYWPTHKGHINIRWNAPGKPGFGYDSPSKDQVRTIIVFVLIIISD
jgi:hypothetical protein